MMKIFFNIFMFILFGLFCFLVGTHWNDLSIVHAQVSSPSYTCQTGNGGQVMANPCAQYIVEINTDRSTGKGFNVYQIESGPVDVRTLSFSQIAGSTLSGLSVQAFQPGSTTQTFTLTLGTP